MSDYSTKNLSAVSGRKLPARRSEVDWPLLTHCGLWGMKGLNKAAAYLITLYQKFISPHKGFRCAASAYYGSASCSQTVKQIILQDGIVSGLARIRQQFNLCSVAARSIKEEDQEDPEKKTKDDCTACDMTQSGCQTACCLISYWG